MPADITVKLDTAKLSRMILDTPFKAQAAVRKIAQDMEADIKTHFARRSPAPDDGPPGVDTGFLKNSITAEPQGAYTWIVRDGTDYGAALEFGTARLGYRKWPFFRPVAARAAKRLPSELKREIFK